MLHLRTPAVVALVVAALTASGLAAPDVRTRTDPPRVRATAKIQGAVGRASAETASDTISGLTVRLRSLTTDRVEGITATDASGRFTFPNVEAGEYRIEVLSGRNALQVISPKLSVAPGETVGLFMRVGTRVPWFSGFFANTAANAVSTAASVGVTAVTPEVQDSSPER